MHQLDAATAAAAAAAAAAATLIAARRFLRQPLNLPPGPPTVPLLESQPWIGKSFRQWMLEEGRQYGDVYGFTMMGDYQVCLNSYVAIQEAFIANANETSGRISSAFTKQLHRDQGLLTSEGDLWRQLRRLSLQWLRDLGFGKSQGNNTVAAEAEELCNALRQTGGQAVDTGDLFNRSVANVICQLVFGKRLGTDDQDFEARLKEINVVTQSGRPPRSLLYTAFSSIMLKVWPSVLLRAKEARKFVDSTASLNAYCQFHIDAKRQQLQQQGGTASGHDASDFIEAFFASAAAGQHSFGDLNLQVCIMDLFLAGTDTTANSLRWMALHLAQDQQLQQRLWQAINDELGTRQPSMADRALVPLLESFLHELQRYYTLVPLALGHKTSEVTRVQGYDIPKGTIVYSNLQAVHFDPQAFDEPQQFRADRFIDRSGKFTASNRVIPFGIGRRSCLGESLARSELFIFTVVLLQHLHIGISDSELSRIAEISHYSGGAVHAPGVHKLIFTERN